MVRYAAVIKSLPSMCIPYALVIMAFICLLNISICESVDFNGYVRSGAIWSDKTRTSCLQVPGARAKYRLGNECETYSELSLSHTLGEVKSGPYVTTSTMLALVSDLQDDFENITSFWPETYFETGGWFNGKSLENAKLWIGKRYYRRHDVHINDFYYWSNSGYGAGVQDISLGKSTFAYAYRRNRFVDTEDINGHDLRWYDINTNLKGALTIGLDLRNSSKNHSVFSGKRGKQLHFQHYQDDILGGYNKIAYQFGQNIGSNLSSLSDNTLISSDKSHRVVEQLLVEMNDQWSTLFTLVYEQQKDVQVWHSVGFRPVYYISDMLNIALELGHDRVKPESALVKTLSKITIAPQISKGRGFWTRPTVRVFVTYANWNAAARDSGLADGATGVFGATTHGMNYGIQIEHWW